MAGPSRKRYREDSFASDNEFSEDSVGPDGIFPSESESDEDDDTRECFFPSEESNQANMDSHTINLSDSSLSQQEMPETEEIGEEMVHIGEILVSTCCENFCLRRLTAMDVIASKAEQSQCQNRSERSNWLFTKLRENSSETNKGDLQTRYFVAGKEICSSAWCKLFSVSHRTLQRMQSKLTFEDGIQHGNSGKKRLNTKTEAAVAWMERYFNLIGDKMPDKDQIHLPCWETQKDIYHRYSSDVQKRGEEILGISMFYKIWTEKFSNVVIPEVSEIMYIIANCHL